MRTWVRPEPVALPPELLDAVGEPYLAEFLYRRGLVTPEAALRFLTGGIDQDAPGLPDLDEGVATLAQAVLAGRQICVYGDYDTDGVTATALLVGVLRSVGARVTYHVPNRFLEGYGMHGSVVESLAAKGIGLILTCDCGIRNLQEVALARRLGMQVVVTDHHELGPELPEAEAVINPKRLPEPHPCHMLPGVGTAYLVARQLYRALDRDPAEADRWLDLVAVGIIADVVPLTGANRELARRGLSRINTSPALGLQALLVVAGVQGRVTEEELAFQVVPRLNAAGRLENASLGVELLLAGEPEAAQVLAERLDQLNQERKRLTTAVVEAAAAEVKEGAGAILLYRPEWHEGVLGIAASKLAEQYGVPAFLMARKHGQSQVLVGSARAPVGFPLHEALDACGEHLIKHGGHAGAAGFSLLEDRFAAFRAAMLEEARRRSRPGRVAEPYGNADIALPLQTMTRELYESLRRAAPFGEGNPEPRFYSPAVKILSSRPIGAGDKHLRLVLRDGEQAFVGVWWNAGVAQLEPQEVDLVYRVGLNRWRDEELLQVVVEQVGPGIPVLEAAPALMLVRPTLVDRRGAHPANLLGEFPGAICFAEGAQAPADLEMADRYSVRQAPALVLLTPPPSPRLLEELAARTGAEHLVMAWPAAAPPAEERFLPNLMKLVAEESSLSPYVGLSRLSVRTGELEVAVRLGLDAMAESCLLAVEEDAGELLRLRRRSDGRGIRESDALTKMRRLLGESRAFRRFLRTASLEAIERSLYLNSTTSSSPSAGWPG